MAQGAIGHQEKGTDVQVCVARLGYNRRLCGPFSTLYLDGTGAKVMNINRNGIKHKQLDNRCSGLEIEEQCKVVGVFLNLAQ